MWPKRWYPGRTIEAAREEATRLSTVLVGSLGGFGSGLVGLRLKHLMAFWWELFKSHCFNYFRLNHCFGLQILIISSPFFSRWVLSFCPFHRRMRWLQVKLPGGCGQWKVRSLRSLNFNHDQQPISRPFSSETVVGKQEKGSISVSKHVAGNKDRPHIKSFQFYCTINISYVHSLGRIHRIRFFFNLNSWVQKKTNEYIEYCPHRGTLRVSSLQNRLPGW